MTTLIFDFDGTLHDTIRIYAPAFRKALQYLFEKGFTDDRDWSNDKISRWLGYSSRYMWDAFMPQLPETEKEICSKLIGNEMLRAIKLGEAQLYNGAENTLRQLKADYDLIFLSNCKISYMEECIRRFALERFFTAFYCTEQYDFAPKDEIFKEIAAHYPGRFIIIGDRETDFIIAKRFQLPFIGCAYGYGDPDELGEADHIANELSDLLPMIGMIETS